MISRCVIMPPSYEDGGTVMSLLTKEGRSAMDTAAVHMNSLPGLLRKGDLVEDRTPAGGTRSYVLTKHPEHGMITFAGQPVPVIYLTGMDHYEGRKVITVKVARLAVRSSRELALEGRPAPLFFKAPDPGLY